MQICRCLVLMVLVMAVASCNEPTYLIKGFQLPEGSIVTGSSEDINLQGNNAIIPTVGRAERKVSVVFENSKGWASVTEDLDKQLLGRGFTVKEGFDLPYLRTYTNTESGYAVMAQDMYGPFEGEQRKLRDPTGKGLFSLGIAKMKEFGNVPR